MVQGKGVEEFRNEAGGHRIQRIPPTEKRDRVHTSTVTVAVMVATEIDQSSPFLRRGEADFRVEWFSGQGAGGQHRNRSAPFRHT